MTLGRFFTTMLRIGATGFGGPMALISMLQDHLVERRKAVSSEEFAEGVAIGQILPGPIAIDAAIHVGYRLKGWLGAILGAVGLILPPFVIMLILTPLYFHYGKVPSAQGFFAGVRPAVVAAIAAAAFRLGKRGLKTNVSYAIAFIVFAWMVVRDYLTAAVAADPVLADSAWSVGLHWTGSIFLIVISGVLGMIFLTPAAPEPKPEAKPDEDPPDPGSDGEGGGK